VLATTNQTFALTTLFNDAKLAGELGSFIQTVPTLLFYQIAFASDKKSNAFYLFACLFPQPCLAFTIVPQINSSYALLSANLHKYSSGLAIFMLFFDCIFYFLLYVYLDEVLPNEYGIRKHPIYCLK
jgi:ATP-binding cassette subfamily A (ABC1) protein 3